MINILADKYPGGSGSKGEYLSDLSRQDENWILKGHVPGQNSQPSLSLHPADQIGLPTACHNRVPPLFLDHSVCFVWTPSSSLLTWIIFYLQILAQNSSSSKKSSPTHPVHTLLALFWTSTVLIDGHDHTFRREQTHLFIFNYLFHV